MKNKNLFNSRFIFDETGPSRPENIQEVPGTIITASPENADAKQEVIDNANEITSQLSIKALLKSMKTSPYTPDIVRAMIFGAEKINEKLLILLGIKVTRTVTMKKNLKEIKKLTEEQMAKLKTIKAGFKDESEAYNFQKDSHGYKLKKGDNPSQVAKKILEKHNTTVTNKQIRFLASAICLASDIAVPSWGIPGEHDAKNLDIGQKIYIPKNAINTAVTNLASDIGNTGAEEDATTAGQSIPVAPPSPERET